MTVAQLEKSMSYRELNEWRAYDQIDPIGGYRQDLQTAFMAYLAYGDKAKHSINDFLVVDPEPMSAELKEKAEREKQKQKLERQTAKLQADIQRVKIKGA
ncbi:phage tail assembly protein T [Psychrobacter namhaensis]|uniref:phage tail assembly protein T n=1 Tax=Psychrobacter namhaensis TaxID=292734 RepID=UPI0018DF7891|nr:phage tail protein [Psychrobacter namhaensis]